jgi:hypothetical protein
MGSRLAGIVEKSGGIRVVVTHESHMHFHVADGEKLYIVPDFIVNEPVAYEDYAGLIEKAESYVKSIT